MSNVVTLHSPVTLNVIDSMPVESINVRKLVAMEIVANVFSAKGKLVHAVSKMPLEFVPKMLLHAVIRAVNSYLAKFMLVLSAAIKVSVPNAW